MGMASYGKPAEDLDWLLRVEKGGYVFEESYIPKVQPGQTNRSKQEPMYSEALVERLGPARRQGEAFETRHYNLASSAQHQLNRAAVSLVESLHEQTGSHKLCIAGGVGLNCVMNQTLLAMEDVHNIFVQPAASDAGAALGAAYHVAVQEGEDLAAFPGAHIGNEFSEDTIRAEIENIGVPYSRIDDPALQAARAVEQGKIVGWYQGRHEFGPRALGSRSILADPRQAEMKDLINIKVKFREEFRPFAPSVLQEDAALYFRTNGQAMPYMTITTDVNKERKDEIAAVVHVDDTSRIQSVDRAATPLYHELISHFKKLTGVPVVLNTSYNVKGQPIVNTPTHALGTLFGSGMDVAFLGPFKVEKKR
jgi:carbamoyltransferase